MANSNLLIISAFAVVAFGCDSRDESQPLLGSATESSTNAVGAAGENSEGTDSAAVDVLGPQGNNPGSVPSTIVAELTSLNIAEMDSPRGHKIFAGNEIRGVLPGAEFDVEYAYFNLDFPCEGDAEFESYPAPLFAASTTDMVGAFTWNPLVPDSETNVWNLDVGLIIAGDEEHSILDDGIEVYPVNWGDIIVGNAVLNKLVVTRIVQYQVCSQP